MVLRFDFEEMEDKELTKEIEKLLHDYEEQQLKERQESLDTFNKAKKELERRYKESPLSDEMKNIFKEKMKEIDTKIDEIADTFN